MPESGHPDEPERAFCEPWHAHVFAYALKLSQAGHFSWAEWTEHFGAHLKNACGDAPAESRPMPDVDSATYYDVWLDALESLLIQRGLATADDLARLKEAWTEAYLNTPHGKPVALGDERGHAHAHGGNS